MLCFGIGEISTILDRYFVLEKAQLLDCEQSLFALAIGKKEGLLAVYTTAVYGYYYNHPLWLVWTYL